MELCREGAEIFATCSRRQYMAILIDDDNHVLGMGYNGVPSGMKHCYEGGCPRALEANVEHGVGYGNCLAIHAETNALIHSNYTSRPSTLYVNGPPCWDCAKIICNSTINRVVYLEDPNYKEFDKVMQLFEANNISTVCLGEVHAS